jgi:hypothetical protein
MEETYQKYSFWLLNSLPKVFLPLLSLMAVFYLTKWGTGSGEWGALFVIIAWY